MFGSLEFRSPPITFAPPRLIDDWRVFVFGDAAGAWLIRPLADQQSEVGLYSTGVGTEFKLFRRLDGDIVAAFPLRHSRGAEIDTPYTQFTLKADF